MRRKEKKNNPVNISKNQTYKTHTLTQTHTLTLTNTQTHIVDIDRNRNATKYTRAKK